MTEPEATTAPAGSPPRGSEARGSELAEHLRTAAAAIGALGPALEAGEPWPLAARFDHSDEASWGPAEVLAHLSEMLPYWTGEMERIVAGARRGLEPVPFGRLATDEVRVAIIGRDRSVPVGELLARIASEADRLARRLATLPTADFARRGRHPVRGEMSAAEVVQRFIVAHLEEHAEQLGPLLRR